MAATRLAVDEPVDVREERGRIVIEPLQQKSYDVRKLVAAIRPKNRHELIDFGRPVGKEVW